MWVAQQCDWPEGEEWTVNHTGIVYQKTAGIIVVRIGTSPD
jgi:hypothetical protein